MNTLALWFLQSQKGLRWLGDLRRWTSTDGSDATISISGATRTPGEYALEWDMSNIDGTAVIEGTYYVCIEAAREKGPYSLIRERFDLLGTSVSAERLAGVVRASSERQRLAGLVAWQRDDPIATALLEDARGLAIAAHDTFAEARAHATIAHTTGSPDSERRSGDLFRSMGVVTPPRLPVFARDPVGESGEGA